MNRNLFLVVIAASCLASTPVRAADAPLATARDYGALPSVADAGISPDGKTLATLRNDGTTSLLMLQDLQADGWPAKAMRMGTGIDARSVVWAGNDHVLLLASRSSKVDTDRGRKTVEFFRWSLVSRKDMKAKMLFDNEGGYWMPSPGTLLSTAQADSGRIVFQRWSAERGKGPEGDSASRLKSRATGNGVSVFAVDLDSGKPTMIAGGNVDTQSWVVDATGKAVARTDKGGKSYLGLSPESALLAWTEQDGRQAIAEHDPDAGEAARVVAADGRFDIGSGIYDERSASVVGYAYVDDMPRRRWFDAQRQQLQDNLARAIPDGVPALWSSSADGRRHVVKVDYSDHPPQWFLFDAQARTLDMFAPGYAALDDRVHARKEAFAYTASDGALVPGYLTVPEGASRKRMPLVVLPHGGPAARDDMAFDWWPFFYAARGYLVYQPNFRGSSGYGKAWRDAGKGQWGKRMQDDISEGVRKLVADGLVDPARVCIVGASYGGYAALMGATRTPELYACAVSVAGVGNVGSLFEGGDGSSNQYWQEEQLGISRFERERLREISPITHARQARSPILLIHGTDDTVVGIGQSRSMARELKLYGKPVTLVELQGEDHWLSAAATRIAMLDRSIEFIDEHIGDR